MATCQYTGLELENKRAKNHPEITKLLEKANKSGAYSAVVTALIDAKNAGVTGLDVVEIGKRALQSGTQAAAAFRTQIRNEQKAKAQERHEQHDARIKFWQEHGYFPTSNENDEDARTDIEEQNPPQIGTWFSDQDENRNF